jgi:hypothetical protein
MKEVDSSQFDLNDDLVDCESSEVLYDEKIAHFDADAILNSRAINTKSYFIREGGASSETEKEFEIFKFWLNCGSGRSIPYLANIFNLQETRLHSLAKKNNWASRTSDYDIDILHEKLKLEQDARAIEHKKRLEDYRLQQEYLGRNLSINAAKLAALSQRTLDEYLDSNRAVDIRDIPSILNSAAKIAEVGKNLQSGALGVEQLLVALEEADFDE